MEGDQKCSNRGRGIGQCNKDDFSKDPCMWVPRGRKLQIQHHDEQALSYARISADCYMPFTDLLRRNVVSIPVASANQTT